MTPTATVPIPADANLNWSRSDPPHRRSIEWDGTERNRVAVQSADKTPVAYTISAYRDLLKGHLIDFYV